MLPALLLCAGVGTRLDPITRLVAKAAVPMAGSTLVERILSWLVGQGVRDVVLNLHHRPETITRIIGDGTQLGVRVRYSWEPRVLGSAGGPRRALPLLDSNTFLIINGDTLCDVDLRAVLDAHERANADVTLVVVPNPAPDHYNGIVADRDGRIQHVLPKGHREETWHFIGIQVVHARLFASLEDGVPAETMNDLYRAHLIARDWKIHAYCVDKPFIDVGTPYDYLRAVLDLAGNDVVLEPGATVSPSSRVRQSVIWSGASVGDHAALDECVVVSGAQVPEGGKIERAVVMPSGVFPFSGTSGRVS